jgi:hypothetical protein
MPARHLSRGRLLLAVAAGVAVVAGLAIVLPAGGQQPPIFRAAFGGPDRLLTNEYAFRHPDRPAAVRSPQWIATSGSLFIEGGAAGDGPLDHTAPNASSSNGTNSAVFRAYTRRRFSPDYRIGLEVRVQAPQRVAGLRSEPWDGLHLMLEARSPQAAYYVSLFRRDRTAVIKKKTAGGQVAGGSYEDLSHAAPSRIEPGNWTPVRVDVRSSGAESVTIDLYEDGMLVTTASDEVAASGSPPYLRGRLGIRADKTRFRIRNLVVERL